MSDRIFGTDGIRGQAGEGWLQADRVQALGRALGRALTDGPQSSAGALLAHDGRRSSPELEAALTAGLARHGVETTTAGLLPTPALARLTRDGDYALGLMISASHNPAADNGIKVFSGQGEKLSDELELRVESLLREEVDQPAGPAQAPALDKTLEDVYLAHLGRAAEGLELTRWTIVLDTANGAGSRVGPRLLQRLGAQVVPMFSAPDGDNINAGCGSTHPEALQAEVVARGAQLGIALDGDGDRCLLVDERGELVNGDGILTLLARHAASRSEMVSPKIVATVMSNRGLHRALREIGVEVVEVGVGDRQVVERMRSDAIELGGEQSGHIVLGRENAYIGDGLFTAIHVLRALRQSGRPLSELVAPYQPFPQVLINVPVATKPPLGDIASVSSLARKIEGDLGQDGRVLLRYSGTESLARVMVEGPDADDINRQARELSDCIERELGE